MTAYKRMHACKRMFKKAKAAAAKYAGHYPLWHESSLEVAKCALKGYVFWRGIVRREGVSCQVR